MLKNYNPSEKEINLALSALKAFESSADQSMAAGRLKSRLYQYLTKASELEHLLSMQYLFAAFSLKKYPEEFAAYSPGNATTANSAILSQLERNRRWEAKLLYVSRQEMEHLNMVQNLIAILGEEAYLYHPNFPVPANENPLGYPIELIPFSKYAVQVFRFWEKPDHLTLNPPSKTDNLENSNITESDSGFDIGDSVIACWEEIIRVIENKTPEPGGVAKESIEELYTCINTYFYFLLKHKLIDGGNINRIVEEHFGFNISLDPIVEGKYYKYVTDVIHQIISEGEGVWGVPPSLDSHFMVFQEILDEISEIEIIEEIANFALPVVENPVAPYEEKESGITSYSSTCRIENLKVYEITNEISILAMGLFNDAYMLLNKMLTSFFNDYSIDYTTGIRPPQTNAFFRTSFYPFMTMVIRPLGEIICRLPADKDYKGDHLPSKTAGPNFFFNIPHNSGLTEISTKFREKTAMEDIIESLHSMSEKAEKLAGLCESEAYHVANYKNPDSRDFNVRFNYLTENLLRIAQNFECYWKGEIIAPISSKNFQNFSDTYN